MAKLQANPLFQALMEAFDLEELRTLCFDLVIDYDSLRGEGKEAKARELILFAQRHQKTPQLVAKIGESRPNLAAQLNNYQPAELQLDVDVPWSTRLWQRALAVWRGLSRPQKTMAAIAGAGLFLLFGIAGYWFFTALRLDVPPAGPNETVVLISAFRSPVGASTILPEQRFATALQHLKADYPGTNLRIELVSDRVIDSDPKARAWGLDHKASLVIWGWYDANAIEAHLTLPQGSFLCGGGDPAAIELADPDASMQLNHLLPTQIEMVGGIVLGWLKYDADEYEEAVALWTKAIDAVAAQPLEVQRSFGFDRLYYCRAYVYEQLGNQAAANADYLQAETLNPENTLAVLESAEAALSIPDYDLALTKAQTVIDKVPGMPKYAVAKALGIAAMSQYGLGNLSEAVSLAEKSVATYAKEASFWLLLSNFYLLQHNWNQADVAAQSAIDNGSKDVWSYLNLARARLHTDGLARARLAYQDAFAKFPLVTESDIEYAISELEGDRESFPDLTEEIDELIALLRTKVHLSWNLMAKDTMIILVNILKVSHHGSANHTPYPDLLIKLWSDDVMQPLAIMSTYPDIDSDFPDDATLGRVSQQSTLHNVQQVSDVG